MWARITWFISNVAFETSMVLQNVIMAVSITVLLGVFSKDKRLLKVLLHIIALYTALFLGNLVIAAFTIRMNMFIISYAAVLILYALFFCRYKPKSKIIICSVFYATSLCLSALAGAIAKIVTADLIGDLISSIIRNGFLALSLAAAFYLRHFSMERHRSIPASSVVLITSFELVAVGLCIFFFFKVMFLKSTDSHTFACVVFAAFTVAGLLAYFMIYNICTEHSNRLQLQAETQALQLSRDMIRINERNLEEMKSVRHDIKNQAAYMQMMLSQQKYEELSDYFNTLHDTMEKPLAFVDCGNKNISEIINMEISKAQTAGIRIETELLVPPVLPFSSSDICSLLTNLIDNAIEACCRYDIQEPVIKVEITQRQDYLLVYVSNPVACDFMLREGAVPDTSKEDKLRHGYGTKIIRRIAAFYGGEVNFSAKEGQFIAELFLDMNFRQQQGEKANYENDQYSSL